MKQEMEDFRTEMGGERSDESKETKCMYLYQKTRKDCLDPTHSPFGDPELGFPLQPYPFGLWLDSRTINRNSQDKTCIDSTWKQSHLKDKGCDVTSISYNACMGVDTQSVSPLHVYRDRPH